MKKIFRPLLLSGLCALMILLLAEAETVRTAALEGLLLCSRTVIPALFPPLAVSSLLEPAYKTWNEKHAALAASGLFHGFRVLRTFVIVNIGWFFDRGANPGDALRMLASVFTQFSGDTLTPAFFEAAGLIAADGIVLACALLIVFAILLAAAFALLLLLVLIRQIRRAALRARLKRRRAERRRRH